MLLLLMKKLIVSLEGYTIIATGPLTTENLAKEIVDIQVRINFIL